LAERYGWIHRALPVATLDHFVKSLAHRVARFPAAGQVAVKNRINVITLAPAEDFRRDSDLFGEGVRAPRLKASSRPRSSVVSRLEKPKWTWRGFWEN
jgi:hypothetical protein